MKKKAEFLVVIDANLPNRAQRLNAKRENKVLETYTPIRNIK